MQKLVALALAFVLAFGFPAVGVIAQGEFDTASGGSGSAVSGPVSGGGGGGMGGGFIQPQPIAPPSSGGGSGVGGGFSQPQPIAPPPSSGAVFVTPQQIAPFSSSVVLGVGDFEMTANDFNFQTKKETIAGQQTVGAEQVCAVRSDGNDVSCFNARESQNLPASRGPCQPWETDCRMTDAPQYKSIQVSGGVSTSSSEMRGGYCGDGFCTEREKLDRNCCEDCNPGPGCGVGPQQSGQSQQAVQVNQVYRAPLAPQFSPPPEAFGMPSAGLMIGQFSPAMIRPEGISREELLLHKYTRYIERYVSSDAEQYCNDIPALVVKATATLEEKAPQLLDITRMCSTIKKQADKCKKFAPQICEQMKKQSGCDENMLEKCKTGMKQ